MPLLTIVVMDRSAHLSVILDLCPTQWLLSAKPSNLHPLSFDTFLSHLLVFLNSHIAYKHENSLAVFGALPGKRSAHFFLFTSAITLKLPSVLFYSSEEAGDSTTEVVQQDPNSYRSFNTVDQSLVHRISREFDILGQPDTEGMCHLVPQPSLVHVILSEPCALVGALTKAICCMFHNLFLFQPRSWTQISTACCIRVNRSAPLKTLRTSLIRVSSFFPFPPMLQTLTSRS